MLPHAKLISIFRVSIVMGGSQVVGPVLGGAPEWTICAQWATLSTQRSAA
jgi:hypothetical protein